MELLKIADTVFLALMIWREARGASKEVKTGIAAVILNRVKKGLVWKRYNRSR